MTESSTECVNFWFQYNIDVQTLEVRGATSSMRDTLTMLGFTFSWDGGPHWELRTKDYTGVVSNLSSLGIDCKLQFKSVSGWNLVENGEADDEWEHIADGVVACD